MYSKILVPLDGSTVAEGVIPHVIALAQCHLSEVVLLQVVTYPSYDYLLRDAALAESLHDSLENDGCDYLRQTVDKYFKGAHLKVTAEVISEHGPVADVILDYASAINAELIAMSTHGRTGPARWMMGSVADRVVRGAQVPVLLIRAQVTS